MRARASEVYDGASDDDVELASEAFDRAKAWLGAASSLTAESFALEEATESRDAAMRRRNPRLGLGATPKRRMESRADAAGAALARSVARARRDAATRAATEATIGDESESDSENDRARASGRGSKRAGGSVYDRGVGTKGKRAR